MVTGFIYKVQGKKLAMSRGTIKFRDLSRAEK